MVILFYKVVTHGSWSLTRCGRLERVEYILELYFFIVSYF